jgi:two-component system, OmpR family, response regulator
MERTTPRFHSAPRAIAPTASSLTSPGLTRLRTGGSTQERSLDEPEHVLRVLLVEDSPLLVQRIVELVDELPNVRLAGTAASEAEAMSCLESGEIDAVILDLQLHTGSGFGILRALHARGAAPSVIVFTNFAITAYRDSAIALGASHFLDKSRDYDRLPGVLRQLSEAAH